MRTRHRRPLSFLILLVATALVASDAPEEPLRGFTPARSRAQRGSVLYLFHYPGDPTTPDGPSVAGAPRIAPGGEVTVRQEVL